MQGFTQIERSGGVVVSVPTNPRLQRLRDKQKRLQGQVEDCRRAVLETERKLHELDQQAAGLADVAQLTTVSKQRQQLKDILDTLAYRQQQAEGQQKQVAEEISGWVDNFARWGFRRQQLIAELPTAPDDGPGVSYMTALGQNEIRSRATVEQELRDVIFKLEGFSK